MNDDAHIDEKLIVQIPPRPLSAGDGTNRKSEEDTSISDSLRFQGRSSLSSAANPRRSILKPKDTERRSYGGEKRISFHENLKEVHEVENWKKYNVVKRGCCEACWEECRLI